MLVGKRLRTLCPSITGMNVPVIGRRRNTARPEGLHHELVQRHQQFSCLVHRAGEQHGNDCNGNADGAKVGKHGENEIADIKPCLRRRTARSADQGAG